MASGVVTRRPPLNSDCDAEAVEHRGDLGAAAVHDDRLEAGEPQEGDVLGEGALEGVVGHGVAAVLHHHDLAVVALQPRQRGGEDGGLGRARRRVTGRASMVMRSRRCSRGRRRGSGRWSRSWRGASPALRSTVTVTSRGGEVDAWRGPRPGVDCRQTQTPFMATSRSAGSNAACVVPMLASTRPQLGSLPKTAALKRLLRAMLRPTSTASSSRGRTLHGDGDLVVGALGVGEQLHGQVGAGAGEGVGEVGQGRRDAGRAAGQEGDGVVGRHAAVGVEPVEADPGRGAQGGVEVLGARDGVGGEDDEHRGQLRGEHAGALGHPADRPAGALDDDLLADVVGGHDRVRPRRRRPAVRGRRTPRRRRPARPRAGWPARSGRSSRRPRRGRRCRRARRPARRRRAWSGSRRVRCSSWRRRS